MLFIFSANHVTSVKVFIVKSFTFCYKLSQNCKKKWLLSRSYLSVFMSAWNTSAPSRRIFMKFDIWGFFENTSRRFRCQLNLTRITGTSSEEPCTFTIISRSILLRMRNVLDKFVEKIKTYILCSVTFIIKSYCIWDNVEKYFKAGQATDDNMAHAHFMLDI